MRAGPMPEDLALHLTDLARAGMPNEVCGFVTRGWELIEMANVHPVPNRGFVMDPDEQLDVMLRDAGDLIGIYHTHPSGVNALSPDDEIILRAYADRFRFWVATVMNVWEWGYKNGSIVPARRDGSPGTTGLAYPVLTATTAVRR